MVMLTSKMKSLFGNNTNDQGKKTSLSMVTKKNVRKKISKSKKTLIIQNIQNKIVKLEKPNNIKRENYIFLIGKNKISKLNKNNQESKKKESSLI